MKPISQRTTVSEVLELSANPTLEEVKKNYKRLALQYHPDRNKAPEALNYMKKLNTAYKMALQILERRKQVQQPTMQYRYRTTIVINVNFYGGNTYATYTGDDFWGGTKS